jgi:hypothetical protein
MSRWGPVQPVAERLNVSDCPDACGGLLIMFGGKVIARHAAQSDMGWASEVAGAQMRAEYQALLNSADAKTQARRRGTFAGSLVLIAGVIWLLVSWWAACIVLAALIWAYAAGYASGQLDGFTAGTRPYEPRRS